MTDWKKVTGTQPERPEEIDADIVSVNGLSA